MVQGKYFYCIIKSDGNKRFGPIGIGGHGDEVYTISYRDISAVVSNISLIEVEADEKNALTHMDVIQRVMEQQTVLPVKFGTIFKDKNGVEKCLAMIYGQVKSELPKMDGKVELGVKVLWHPNKAIEQIKKTSDQVKNMEKEIQSMSEGKAYLMRVKMEQTLNEEINKMSEQYAHQIYRELMKCAENSLQLKLVGYMILYAAFLVSKKSIDDFKNKVNQMQEKWKEKGVELILSGPWPPFNFTNIRYE